MRGLFITYDLPSRRYSEVEKAIAAYGPWARVATTTFVVSTHATTSALRDAVLAAGGLGARIFVCEVGSDWAFAGQPTEVSQWVQANWP